jgi:hypothetical protein
LLDEAHAAFMLKEKHGSPWPEQIVPVYAERDPQHDVTIVLFSGTAPNDDRAFGIWATRVGIGSWDVAENATVVSKRDPKAAARAHERIWGDPLWMQTVEVGQLSLEYLAIVVPVGSDAEIGGITDVAASGVTQFQYDPLELHAGTALLNLSGRSATKIMIINHRDIVSTWTYGVDSGGIYRVDGALTPRPDQIAAAAQHARGQVEADSDAVRDAVRFAAYLQEYRGLHMTFRIIWGGVIDKQPCVLTAMEFDSGALAPLLTCHKADGGATTEWTGPVRAGSFDHTTVAWTSDLVTHAVAPCYVMAPPGAVRAEVEYADHLSVPVVLDNGFGAARHHGRAVTVRIYDGAGHLLEQARVDHNVNR